ncbi:hypothetical protein ACFOYW_09090 [Gryllotalpicola reticulitermitis]|uniref:Uncharacterized protein n=1 Tax=Gryllotalpicola reticulitermitis TaxID=1184153 RepID=A0ABV8Q6X6_9MICO
MDVELYATIDTSTASTPDDGKPAAPSTGTVRAVLAGIGVEYPPVPFVVFNRLPDAGTNNPAVPVTCAVVACALSGAKTLKNPGPDGATATSNPATRATTSGTAAHRARRPSVRKTEPSRRRVFERTTPPPWN